MRRVVIQLASTAAILMLLVHLTGVRGTRGAQEGANAQARPDYIEPALPANDHAYGTIDGKHIWQYVKEQAAIAEKYRDDGHPQFWGRIAGTSGDVEDIQWLQDKYKQAGLTDVHAQTMNLFLPQWSAQSWAVTVTAGGNTVPLSSAQPPYGSPDTGGKDLDLEAVYVGLGSEADFAGRDVKGKAVLIVRAGSGFSYNVGPADVMKRAEDGGAAALLDFDLRGGNYNIQAYRSYTTVPTFELGTQDGEKIRDLIGKAQGGAAPRIKIRLDAKWEPQTSALVWGTLPGQTDETIYVIAHRDGWFDAGGDNASGVASMLGLAEYFGKVPKAQRRRTMIFIGADGHHQIRPGWYGLEWLTANRDRFFTKTALMINEEHPSEVLTHGGVNGRSNTIIPMDWYAGGSSRPQLEKIAIDAFHEFGVPIWDEPAKTGGDDMRPFYWFLPGVYATTNDFMYMHTTGDTPDTVLWTGLEATTRAYAKIIDEVNKLPLSDLQRPRLQEPSPSPGALDLSKCADWIKDSSNTCNSDQPAQPASNPDRRNPD